jgi:hypothetical protein
MNGNVLGQMGAGWGAHAASALSGAAGGVPFGPPGMLAGAALGGAASIGSAAIQSFGAHRANQANIAEARRAEAVQQANLDRYYRESLTSAREQMRFQERMRDTQMQAKVEDLRKAGLNPALAYMQGGAAAPSGTSIQGTTSHGVRANIQNVLAPAVSTGLQMMRTAAELQQIEAQTSYLRANTKRVKQTTAMEPISQALGLGLRLLGIYT